MRRIGITSRTLVLLLGVGATLSACSATASEEAIPYGYAGLGPAYYSDPAYLDGAPLYGDFGFYGFDHDGHHDHDWHHAHVGFHDGGRVFAHGGFDHGGFSHGGFSHGGFSHGGGGHGGGGHGR